MLDLKNCQAGYARLDITPPLGTHLAGYFHARAARGVLDPLYVRAIAFGQEDRRAVVLVCDLLGMYSAECLQWYQSLGEELGLAPGALFITCTHTHTAPIIGEYRQKGDSQYDAWLYRRLHDAALMAMDDLKPVTRVLGINTQAPLMTFVRRWILTDGTGTTTPPFKTEADRALLDHPASDTDESMRVMRILRQDAPELVLVNYQVHPDCTGGDLISADFPGALCAKVEAERPGTRCIYTNGGEGQMVRTDRLGQRGFNFDKGQVGAAAYGRMLADIVLGQLDKATPTGACGLSFGQRMLRARSKRGLLTGDEALRIVTAYDEGRLEDIHTSRKEATYLATEARHILEQERLGIDHYDLPVPGIVFCGLAFVGFAGEPFNEMGRAVRAASRHPVTSIFCQTNGSHCYLPMDFAFDQGGYEPRNTRLARGTAEQLVALAVELLDEL